MTNTITSGSGHGPTVAITERLARAALELHRLALAAAEVEHLPSPRAPRERTSTGASDPTLSTVLDTRRQAVSRVLAEIGGQVAALDQEVRTVHAQVADVLERWDT